MNRQYIHLSREERYEIKRMHDLGVSITKIVQHLTRSKSTISIELKRNKVKDKYMPCVAQAKYENRMYQQELLKIDKNPMLLDYIKNAMIHNKWSPDAISGKLKRDKNIALSISTKSIYRFVYTFPVPAKLKLYSYLPSKRYKRQERGKRRNRIMLPQRISIHQRDAIAMQKLEVGHFEADLTFHKGNQSINIGALVDKKSQNIILVINKSKKAQTVTNGFLRKIKTLPNSVKKLLLWIMSKSL